MLTYAHIGDLHITTEKQQNFKDLLSIAAQIEVACASALDFVYLPGDNADNGLPSQYRLIRTALRLLSMPVHAITGDHDMEQGGLDGFYAHLEAAPLPKAITVQGVRCLFLDISGPGGGGPDFRMGSDQQDWLERELTGAAARRETSVVFAHTYPADLKGDDETGALNRLLARHAVVLVDMGHTHYNELANDGRTVFAATRSTGQIEEGPVGYSLIAVDGGVVSWRFKALDEPFPFVMITSPADHRLLIDHDDPAQVVVEAMTIRAVVFGAREVSRCEFQLADGPWQPLARTPDGRAWTADARVSGSGRQALTVRAFDVSGRPGQDSIVVATGRFDARQTVGDGSDADAIGTWPEKGIPGTQLGPNRNAPGGS